MSAQVIGRRARGGFTLVEMLLALVILSIVMGGAMALIAQQVRSFSAATAGADAIQSARFSIEEVERAARAAGVNLNQTGGQPMLVYADSNVLAFNGDYLSDTQGDIDAVFVDTLAPNAATVALGKTDRFALPGTSFYYPDTTYAGSEHRAETLIFFFRQDSSTSVADDYILFRQANRQPAEVVAQGLRHTGTAAFFQYLRLVSPTTGAPYMDSVPASAGALAHRAVLHMAPTDTGRFAIIDSVRAVRMTFTATSDAPRGRFANQAVSRLIRFPNAGKQAYQTCGDAPLAPSGFTVTRATVSGREVPQLSWNASSDESSGERDVVRYVIYRTVGSTVQLTDPFFNLPASGAGTYTWADTRVDPATTYAYAVAAEDCTPLVGSATASSSTTTPP